MNTKLIEQLNNLAADNAARRDDYPKNDPLWEWFDGRVSAYESAARWAETLSN